MLANDLFRDRKSYLLDSGKLLNLMMVISSFIIYVENPFVSQIFKVIRITRVVQLIYLAPSIKKNHAF